MRKMAHEAEERLLERLVHLINSSDGCVILERVARGGGATRWFYCRDLDQLEPVLQQLRPGSRVGFFFDDRVRREPLSDQVRVEMFDIAATTGEVLCGRARSSGPELQMDLLDSTEVEEYLVGVKPGEIIYFGVVPAIGDGPASVSFTPPDGDGVVRPQPV
jgi:hypothetical protein